MSRGDLIWPARWPDQTVIDWGVALLLAIWGQVDLWAVGGTFTNVPGSRAVAAPFLLLFSLPLAYRRRAPFATTCVVLGAIALESVVVGKAPEGGEVLFPTLIVMYTVGAHCERRLALVGFVLGQIAGAVEASLDPQIHTLGDVVIGDAFFWLFLGGAAWWTGRAVRGRRLAARHSEQRAELLERDQDVLAREAVASERSRIARELHDVIAHSVSLMGLQAAAADRLLEADRQAARASLRSIQVTARESVGELRRLLEFLRARDEPSGLAPQPGLDALEALIATSRRAGAHIDLVIEGDRLHLPAGLALCAYRVVQEALTNARKHAPGARTRVRVLYRPRELELWVESEAAHSSDNGRSPTGTGHGIIGMRERVTLYGGSIDAGPNANGGFVVHARLPVEAAG